MESLKVSNLCKTYIIEKRQNNVLRNVNLEIEQGEMVAVMGRSSAWKRARKPTSISRKIPVWP